MTISDKKKLQIANICYANVAGQFAMFCNPKFRGEKFKWENFSTMMLEASAGWMLIHHVQGKKDVIQECARQYATEISENLVQKSGFLESDQKNKSLT